MKAKNVVKNLGFTLIELLIVVLIIGLLTSIAVPMYKKAAEKSKAVEALSVMSSVAKSEHDFILAKNSYTKDFANLNIEFFDKEGNKASDQEFEGKDFTFTLGDTSIKATRNTNEYSIFKDYESGAIYCLPLNHYVCEQFSGGINETICNNVEGTWHKTSSTCYGASKERCLAEYGENFWISTDENDPTKGYCGYKNPPNNTTLYEGMECTGKCNGLILKDGAVCKGSVSDCYSPKIYSGSSCLANESHSKCNGSTIYAGGKCLVTSHGCGLSTVYGTCEARGRGSCNVATVEDGGVCIGRADETCSDSTFKSGATCIAYHSNSCKKGNNKENYSYQPGSTCQGEVSGGCSGLVNMQGTCIANVAGACTGNAYTNGGCCKGPHCPTNDSNVVLCSN